MAEPAGSVSELSLPSAQPMNLGHLVGSPTARYANYIGQCYPFFVACLLLEIAVFLFSERKKRLQQQQAPSSASPHVASLSPRAALVKSNGEPTNNTPHDAAISAAVLHNVEQTDQTHASSRMNSDPPVYRTNNAVISMCTGMLQETAHIFFINYMLYVPYLYVWENYALYRMPVNAATWVFTLLGIDLAYYWLHRMAHEVNMLWAHHITHHNSEDYNLTTALRQGAFQYSFGCLFYTPLAFFVPPVVFSFHQQFNRLYQFWIHTVYIDKLPFPFESLLVSPSHHRVHHGRNKEYIDKNYGGCFIIWDKLFGTFEEERKTAVYGVTTNLTTWDPWTATFHHWGEMWRAAQRQDSLYMKVSVLWRSPGWVFYQLEHNARDLKLRPRVRFHTSSPLSLNCYACVQALLLMATLRVLALTQCVVRSWLYGGLVAHIFFSTYCFGALYDAKPIGRVLEALRCAYMLVFSLFGALSSPSAFAAATLWSPSIPDSLSASYHRLSLGSARLLALLGVDRPPHAALWTVVSALWAVSLLCVWRMAIAHTASSQAAAPGVGEGDSADNKKNA